jgi:diaminopimelate decarboxylase
MHHFAYKNGVLHCEDVALHTIAERVKTPAYVYSAATLRRHAYVLKEALATLDPLIAFAVKANANIAVLNVLAREGLGADTVSMGEIKRALRAGVSPEKIIFSGVGKGADEIAFALRENIGQINVESGAEFDTVATIARHLGVAAPIALRINPAIGAGGHDKIATGAADAKFGVSLADAATLYARAHALSEIKPMGLAVHIGSQIKDLRPLEEAFTRIRSLAQDLRAEGFPVPRIDLGGGLGVPYFHEPDPPGPSEYAAMVARVFRGFDAAFAFEPGRMIAANAGILLTRVLRRQPRPGRDALVLDAGMNDLLRPSLYDAYHDLWPLLKRPDAPEELVDLVGPVCETGDTFARARPMPRLEAEDLAAFMTAGAYGAAMASTYNARPLAPEVMVSGDRFHIVRARWSVEDQLRLEETPPWLTDG